MQERINRLHRDKKIFDWALKIKHWISVEKKLFLINHILIYKIMKIKSLHIQNFRGFEDVKIEFPDTNLAVFIGENGSGKSSVLDCVGILLANYLNNIFNFPARPDKGFEEAIKKKPDLGNYFEKYNKISKILGENTLVKDFNIEINDINLKSDDLKISFKLGYDEEDILSNMSFNRNRTRNNSIKSSEGIMILGEKLLNNPRLNLPILIYYPTNRIWQEKIEKTERKQYKFSQFNAYANAFGNSLEVFDDFFEWFRNEEDYERDTKLKNNDLGYVNPKLEVIRKALNIFLLSFSSNQYENLRIERLRNDEGYEFSDKTIDVFLAISKNNQTFRFEQLSSGEKMLLMMVADIARRLTIANPSLEGEAALQGEGIILIDEIELHLHPSWQREVIPALRATFPNIQFLITTHSPQALSGIKKIDEDALFILKDFHVFKPSSSAIGRDSNGILEEIMGVSKRPKEIEDLINEYFNLISKTKYEESEVVKQALMTKLAFDDPFFVQAESTLKRKMILGR